MGAITTLGNQKPPFRLYRKWLENSRPPERLLFLLNARKRTIRYRPKLEVPLSAQPSHLTKLGRPAEKRTLDPRGLMAGLGGFLPVRFRASPGGYRTFGLRPGLADCRMAALTGSTTRSRRSFWDIVTAASSPVRTPSAQRTCSKGDVRLHRIRSACRGTRSVTVSDHTAAAAHR